MAHKTHRWAVLSVQHSTDLQHTACVWHCRVRGCWQTVTQYHVFRKPKSTQGNVAAHEPDWRRNA